jgi:hypothetical protein
VSSCGNIDFIVTSFTPQSKKLGCGVGLLKTNIIFPLLAAVVNLYACRVVGIAGIPADQLALGAFAGALCDGGMIFIPKSTAIFDSDLASSRTSRCNNSSQRLL